MTRPSTGFARGAGAARLALVVGALLLGGTAASARAETPIGVAAGVRAGSLSLVQSGADGTLEVVQGPEGGYLITGTLGPLTVVDARGSGAGWRLALTAACSATPDAPAAGGEPLVVTGVAVETRAGRFPVNTVPYPLGVAGAQVGGAPTVVFSAAPGSGKGTFSIAPRVSLALAADGASGPGWCRVSAEIAAGP